MNISNQPRVIICLIHTQITIILLPWETWSRSPLIPSRRVVVAWWWWSSDSHLKHPITLRHLSHSVLCPMLRRRSSSMSRACGSACSSSPAMEVPLSKQFVPSTAFQTICPRHRFSNNLSQAPLSKQCVPGTAFNTFVTSSAFQTICFRHTIRAL